jgi:hypothetical protein
VKQRETCEGAKGRRSKTHHFLIFIIRKRAVGLHSEIAPLLGLEELCRCTTQHNRKRKRRKKERYRDKQSDRQQKKNEGEKEKNSKIENKRNKPKPVGGFLAR